MLGFGFAKAQPTTYLIEYKNGKAVREGAGLSFVYWTPTTSLVAVPIGSRDLPFMFEVQTVDFQAATVQGQATFRIALPRNASAMLNFTLKPDAKTYASQDPEKLPERISAIAKVVIQAAISPLTLREALKSTDAVAVEAAQRLTKHAEIRALGIELLGLSILAIKPAVETGRALEAEAREAILKAADDAVFERRNSAVDGERRIRENELNTEIAVELKKRQIRETQLEAEASLHTKRHDLDRTDMEASIGLEEERKAFVERKAANARTLAEADAHRVHAVVNALKDADPRIVQALAAGGMDPAQLIAQAFGGIAERAERIGELNMSPELLSGLLNAKRKETERGTR
jgi:hypothetical protein